MKEKREGFSYIGWCEWCVEWHIKYIAKVIIYLNFFLNDSLVQFSFEMKKIKNKI